VALGMPMVSLLPTTSPPAFQCSSVSCLGVPSYVLPGERVLPERISCSLHRRVRTSCTWASCRKIDVPIFAVPVRAFLRRIGVVIQSDTDGTSMVAIVLSNDGSGAEFPQTGVVVAAHGHQVRRVSTERAIPHPALMIVQYCITRKGPLESDEICQGAEGGCRH